MQRCKRRNARRLELTSSFFLDHKLVDGVHDGVLIQAKLESGHSGGMCVILSEHIVCSKGKL
jgi:hypothetical protein